ncbi:MAG TPA: MFS transporter, partial [Opitutaceae bacterium]
MTQGPAGKGGRFRFAVLALLFVNVAVNYLDRANLSVAAPDMARDLRLGPRQMGWIFSSFGWAYTLLQIPGGWMVDRVSSRILYSVCLAFWSAATFLQGFARGAAGLFGFRLGTGAFEAPAYPINNKVVTAWFAPGERATAIAVYTAAQYASLAFLHPVMQAVQGRFGWRALFMATGALGAVWACVWHLSYREKSLPGGSGPGAASVGAQSAAWRSPALWGIYIGQFSVSSILWFFLTWFPTYLEQYRGFPSEGAGWIRAAPF